MSYQTAYGTETVKQALLEDVRNGGDFFTKALSYESVELDITEQVQQQNLHPALVRLVSNLGQYGLEEDGRAFFVSALEELKVGADQLDIIRRWYLSIWSQSEYALEATLEGTPLLQPATKIIDLVEASRAGPVDRMTWRKARAALASEVGEEEEGKENPLSSLADPLLSMAWDLEQTPGSAADVANGIGGRIFWSAHKDDADQFTPEENQTLSAAYQSFHQQAIDRIGEITPGNAEQYETYQAIVAELWETSAELKALKMRSNERQERVKAVSKAWRDSARGALLDCIKA